jgi:hypothetical protein
MVKTDSWSNLGQMSISVFGCHRIQFPIEIPAMGFPRSKPQAKGDDSFEKLDGERAQSRTPGFEMPAMPCTTQHAAQLTEGGLALHGLR